MWRILGVAVAVLLTILALNFANGAVSAPDNLSVAYGAATFLALAVAWYFIGRNCYRYTKGRIDAKGLAVAVLALGAMIGASGCGRTVIEPGHVGIVVNSYGTNRGVQDYTAVTGVVWYNPVSTDVIEYPVFVQNVSWTKDVNEGHPANEEISFNTADQMVVYADISLAYQLNPKKAPAFYVKFRADDIDAWTHGFLRNLARQRFDEVAGKYKIEQIMGDNAPFLHEVRAAIQADVNPYGIKIEQLGFNGSPRPPQPVIDAINAKAKATQDAIRVENEVRQAHAQAEKDVVRAEGEAKAAIAKAEGESKSNALVNSSLTPSLLEWRRLDIQEKGTDKWDGKLPLYSGGGTPLIQFPGGKP